MLSFLLTIGHSFCLKLEVEFMPIKQYIIRPYVSYMAITDIAGGLGSIFVTFVTDE